MILGPVLWEQEPDQERDLRGHHREDEREGPHRPPAGQPPVLHAVLTRRRDRQCAGQLTEARVVVDGLVAHGSTRDRAARGHARKMIPTQCNLLVAHTPTRHRPGSSANRKASEHLSPCQLLTRSRGGVTRLFHKQPTQKGSDRRNVMRSRRVFRPRSIGGLPAASARRLGTASPAPAPSSPGSGPAAHGTTPSSSAHHLRNSGHGPQHHALRSRSAPRRA